MIDIEVAYGTDKKQFLQQLAVEEGTTAREAVLQSGLSAAFPEADLHAPLGFSANRSPTIPFCGNTTGWNSTARC